MATLETDFALLVCPGDTIREELEVLRMSQRELAERMGYPANKLNQLIDGQVALTRETAGKLERTLGIKASIWLNLEARYQSEKLSLEQREQAEKQAGWAKGFPLKQLCTLGLLSTTKAPTVVEELLTFFGIAAPEGWEQIYLEKRTSVTFKLSLAGTADPKSLSVWLRYGDIHSRSLQLADYDRKQFRQVIERSSDLVADSSPNALSELQHRCQDAGVALVYTPSFNKAKVYGATRWLNPKTPLIQISDRYHTSDHFWFSFYHEAAHLLLHGKKAVFLDGVPGLGQSAKEEAEADNLAAKILLKDFPIANYAGVEYSWSQQEVVRLSQQYSIHPGVMVAQLQRVGSLPKSHLNGLKQRISFDSPTPATAAPQAR